MLLELLRRLEWARHDMEVWCPECHGVRVTGGGNHGPGHEADCSLANCIKQLEGQLRGKPAGGPAPLADDKDVRGLYDKFEVVRADGDVKHHGRCRYFVLDLTHDSVAREAGWLYADHAACPGVLADELCVEIDKISDDVKGNPCPGPCKGVNRVHEGDPMGLCIHCGPK